VKFKSYFESYDLWDVVKEEKSLQQLFANPTIVQIKTFSKELLDKTMLLSKEEKRKKK